VGEAGKVLFASCLARWPRRNCKTREEESSPDSAGVGGDKGRYLAVYELCLGSSRFGKEGSLKKKEGETLQHKSIAKKKRGAKKGRGSSLNGYERNQG